MNHPDLHLIAEQLYADKAPEDVSLAGVSLSLVARLQLVDQALLAFPSEASLWAGSNEVVLPAWDGPRNILPFNRFTQAPLQAPRTTRPTAPRTPRPKTTGTVPPLKVHWRLKIAIRRQKQRIYLELVWRQESLQNAYRDFLQGVGDWATVRQVHLEYIDKIRDANIFINAVRDDQEEYYWTRSKSWQNSDSAWAYRVWMEAWEREIPSPSLPPRTGAADLKLDAAKTLRGIPDEPAETE